MTLVVDNRATTGPPPALHMLVAGVGTYAKLPRLNSAALSAYGVARWFVDHTDSLALTLATVRLLLSPSPLERRVLPRVGRVAHRCTVSRFRDACVDVADDLAHGEGNLLLCYFAGHGSLPNSNESSSGIVFLDDQEGQRESWPADKNAVAIDELIEALGRGQSSSQAQLFLIDACRTRDADRQAAEIWRMPRREAAPSRNVLFSTGRGQRSWGVSGERTIYCQALIACLEGEAAFPCADGRLVVSLESLACALQRLVPGLLRPPEGPPARDRLDEQSPEFSVAAQQRILVNVDKRHPSA
jgi:hypothetical protein